MGNRGNTVSVTLGDQVYRVKYSGHDGPLERFSITSVDPIVGKWGVMLESVSDVIPDEPAMENPILKFLTELFMKVSDPDVHAVENVVLKVKYRPIDTNLITVSSD